MAKKVFVHAECISFVRAAVDRDHGIVAWSIKWSDGALHSVV